MTGLNFSYTNNSAELARRKLMAWLGNTIIEVASADNNNVDPLGVEGWQIFGRVTQSSPARNVEYVDIRTGTPETSKGSIVIGDSLEFGVSFDHPTLLGFILSNGNTYQYMPNYASNGQTTVASAGTRASATLTAGTGFGKGDMFEIDLTSTSFGQFKEIGFITGVSGNAVTFTRLPQIPPNGSSFKKIAGWSDTSTSKNSGIKLYIGGVEVPRYKMRRLTYNVANKNILVEYYPEVEIISPVPLNLDDSKNLITGGFGVRVIGQTANITNTDGVVLNDAVYLGEQYILPYAS